MMSIDDSAGRRAVRIPIFKRALVLAGAAHFLMQQADRIGFVIVGPEGVRAHQFGEAVGLVGFRLTHAAHFVQHHFDAGVCGLPGGFRAGHAAADNMDR